MSKVPGGTWGGRHTGVRFIAEVGPNHDGSVERALELVERIAASGADAVKFQTYASAATVTARHAPLARYMSDRSPDADQQALLERVRLGFDDFRVLAIRCRELDLVFLSTPFDVQSVEFLSSLGVPALKLPSGEITNAFLLRAAADTGLPLMLSTGMSTLDEVAQAVELIRERWRGRGVASGDLTLLHCTSAYPAPVEAANLLAMEVLRERFGVPVGYSDHTLGSAVPVAAAALGAVVIEKHVTPDPAMPGPDHAASLALAELPALVARVRRAALARGQAGKFLEAVEEDVRRVARRSLAAARRIVVGEQWSAEALTALRPGTGLSPMQADELLGRPARRGYEAGELLDAGELA